MPEQISDQMLEAIRQVKKTHGNMVVTLGITFGVILGVYFFTFPQFLDRAPSVVTFQAITAVMMFIAFFFLKRIAFFLTKLKLGRKEGCATVLAKVSCADLDKDEEKILGLMQ